MNTNDANKAASEKMTPERAHSDFPERYAATIVSSMPFPMDDETYKRAVEKTTRTLKSALANDPAATPWKEPLKCPICGHRYKGMFCKHDISKEVMPSERPTVVRETPEVPSSGEVAPTRKALEDAREPAVIEGERREAVAQDLAYKYESLLTECLPLVTTEGFKSGDYGERYRDLAARMRDAFNREPK